MKRSSRFTNAEVAQILKVARRPVRHPGLDILCAPAAQKLARILVITPRRSGNSPERNLVRRRIKSIFYENKFYELGYDCIVIIKQLGVEVNFEELKKLLVDAFDRMK
jgi:ribonuclease P protein component